MGHIRHVREEQPTLLCPAPWQQHSLANPEFQEREYVWLLRRVATKSILVYRIIAGKYADLRSG